MGAHVQHAEEDARVLEQSIHDAFQKRINPMLTRLAQEIIKARAEIPKYIEESYSDPASMWDGTPIAITPASENLELIERVVIIGALPSGNTGEATATMTVGPRTFQWTTTNVAANATAVNTFDISLPLGIVVRAREKRTVSVKAATPLTAGVPLYVALIGCELPITRY